METRAKFEQIQGFLGLSKGDQEIARDYLITHYDRFEGDDLLAVWRPCGGKITLILEGFDIYHEVIHES